MELTAGGCVFCDVSRDKGTHGLIERNRTMAQIMGLPELDGRKIPFELTDEYPIRSLGRLLEDAETSGIMLSQVNLVCRVDDVNGNASELGEVLILAQRQGVRILSASIGLESFSGRLLQISCKAMFSREEEQGRSFW